MSLDRQFRKAVRCPFSRLSVDDLKPIALGFWHEGYIPELNDFDLDELKKAAYLIDRFRGYNCISKPQKKKLANLVKKIEQNLPESLSIVDNVENLEPLAKKWNLKEDVSHLISPLLKYQTRHYIHARA